MSIDMQPGTRVGAIESIVADTKTIRLYGYGTYLGMGKPKGLTLNGISLPNPQIKLDNGKEVWGYMCWWSSEEAIKKNISHHLAQGFKVEEVDPPPDLYLTNTDEFAQA